MEAEFGHISVWRKRNGCDGNIATFPPLVMSSFMHGDVDGDLWRYVDYAGANLCGLGGSVCDRCAHSGIESTGNHASYQAVYNYRFGDKLKDVASANNLSYTGDSAGAGVSGALGQESLQGALMALMGP